MGKSYRCPHCNSVLLTDIQTHHPMCLRCKLIFDTDKYTTPMVNELENKKTEIEKISTSKKVYIDGKTYTTKFCKKDGIEYYYDRCPICELRKSLSPPFQENIYNKFEG